MPRVLETHRLTAVAIFDLEDRYVRQRRVGESHPRPIGSVSIYLVGQMIDGQRQNLPKPQKLVVQRNPSGYYLFFGEIVQDNGTSRRVELSSGTYVVRVKSQFYQEAERSNIILPRHDAAYFFDLNPGFAYPFPSRVWRTLGPTLLRGSLHQRDGTGIAGAEVQVVGMEQQVMSYTTDHTGQWVLVFPHDQPSGDITVRFTLSDSATKNVTTHVVRGRETSLLQTALRGWVLTETRAGIRGATINVDNVDGYIGETTTDRDGGWFYYFDLDQPAARVRVTATLADGRSLTQENVPLQPGATTAVSTFRFV